MELARTETIQSSVAKGSRNDGKCMELLKCTEVRTENQYFRETTLLQAYSLLPSPSASTVLPANTRATNCEHRTPPTLLRHIYAYLRCPCGMDGRRSVRGVVQFTP